MPLHLFFISAETEDGYKYDLLVKANTQSQARALWRQHFDLPESQEVDWMGAVPGIQIPADAIAGAISWDDIRPKD